MELERIRNEFSTSYSSALSEARRRLVRLERELEGLRRYIEALESLPTILTQGGEKRKTEPKTIRSVAIEMLREAGAPVHVRDIVAEIRRRNIPTEAENLEKSVDATLIQLREREPLMRVGTMTWLWKGAPVLREASNDSTKSSLL